MCVYVEFSFHRVVCVCVSTVHIYRLHVFCCIYMSYTLLHYLLTQQCSPSHCHNIVLKCDVSRHACSFKHLLFTLLSDG